MEGKAPESLLDTYSEERVAAADENIMNSTRSTDFITPKSKTSLTFRNAVLTLARDRAAAVNPKINAIVRDVPAALPSDEIRGPFAGVPFLIKDLAQDYAGLPSSHGSRSLKALPATEHATIVQRWLDAVVLPLRLHQNGLRDGAVDAAAEIAGGGAPGDADHHRDDGGQRADHQRDAAAMQDAGKDAAAKLVAAQGHSRVRQRPGQRIGDAAQRIAGGRAFGLAGAEPAQHSGPSAPARCLLTNS